MTKRVDLVTLYPYAQGHDVSDWSNHLLSHAAEHGTYRQCSLGWHDECSQRGLGLDAECMCICHDPDTTTFTVEGYPENGEQVISRAKRGKKKWPPREDEPEGTWAHWVLARTKKEAKMFAIAKENGLKEGNVK